MSQSGLARHSSCQHPSHSHLALSQYHVVEKPWHEKAHTNGASPGPMHWGLSNWESGKWTTMTLSAECLSELPASALAALSTSSPQHNPIACAAMGQAMVCQRRQNLHSATTSQTCEPPQGNTIIPRPAKHRATARTVRSANCRANANRNPKRREAKKGAHDSDIRRNPEQAPHMLVQSNATKVTTCRMCGQRP